MALFCRFIGHSYVYVDRPQPPSEAVARTRCSRCGEQAIVLWDMPFPGGKGPNDPMIVPDDEEGRELLKNWREYKSRSHTSTAADK